MAVTPAAAATRTRRLTLRAPCVEDAPRLADLADDPAIARMTQRMPNPYRLADAQRFVADVLAADARRANTFVIAEDGQGVVGVIGAFYSEDRAPEVGYWIGRPFWGRGYATEALNGVLGWAAARWRKRVLVSGHFADNAASGRVLEKAGFLYTGERRRAFSRARGAEADKRMMIWLA